MKFSRCLRESSAGRATHPRRLIGGIQAGLQTLRLTQDSGSILQVRLASTLLLTASDQLGLHHVTGQHRQHRGTDNGQPLFKLLFGEVQLSGTPGAVALQGLIAQVAQLSDTTVASCGIATASPQVTSR